MEEPDPAVIMQAVAQAPDAVVIVDTAGVICYWNLGAERIFGYCSAEMLGSSLDPIIPERLRQRHNDGFGAAIARGSSRYGDDHLLAVPALTPMAGASPSSSAWHCCVLTTDQCAMGRQS